MDSLELKAQAMRIAVTLRDVSSENILDVTDKIYKYLKRDVSIESTEEDRDDIYLFLL